MKKLFYPLLFLFAFVYFGALAMLGLDFHHDGVMLLPALRVAAGDAVFRDVYCQYGLLTPLLQGAAVAIFGPYLLTIKLLTALFYAGNTVLLDAVWKRFLAGSVWRIIHLLIWFGLAPGLVVTFHPWSSVYALFFTLAALEMLLRRFEGGKIGFLAVSGVFTALAFLTRHPCGFVTAGALAATLVCRWTFAPGKRQQKLRDFFRESRWWIGGALPVLGSAALYLTVTCGWRDFYIQCLSFVGKFAWERGGGGDWKQFSETMFPLDSSFFPYDTFFTLLPLATIGLLIYELFGRRKTGAAFTPRTALIAVLLIGVASWHQYYPVPCVRHLYWAAAPMLGAYVLAAKAMWQRRSARAAKIALTVVLLLFPAAAVWLRLYLWSGSGRTPWQMHAAPPRFAALNGMRLNREETVTLTRLAAITWPDELLRRGVFNFTTDPLFTAILPPTGFHHPQFLLMETISTYPDYAQKALEYIDKNRPAVLTETITPPLPENYTPQAVFSLKGKQYTLSIPFESTAQ